MIKHMATVTNNYNMESSGMQNTVRPLRKPKRFRSAFTTEQIEYLERQFKKFPYISSEHRKEIAITLKMQERAIKIWFQNRRMKEKKETTNKEFDDVTNKEESGKDRLINACTFPLANEQLSYSLPMIVKPDTMRFIKPNTDNNYLIETQETCTQLEPENLSTNQNKGAMQTCKDLNIKHQPSFLNVPQKETSKKLMKKTVFKKNVGSLDLSKRLKRVRKELNMDHKPKLQRKLELHHSIAAKPRSHVDLPFKRESQPSKLKPVKVKEPSYFPVMPTVYAHPYISPEGVIWKPVNVMPMVAPTPISLPNATPSFGYDQKVPCGCNCHGISQPLTLPNAINPYAQYVITASSYQSPSPKF